MWIHYRRGATPGAQLCGFQLSPPPVFVHGFSESLGLSRFLLFGCLSELANCSDADFGLPFSASPFLLTPTDSTGSGRPNFALKLSVPMLF